MSLATKLWVFDGFNDLFNAMLLFFTQSSIGISNISLSSRSVIPIVPDSLVKLSTQASLLLGNYEGFMAHKMAHYYI